MVVGGPHTPPFHFSCNGAEPFHESCSLIVLCMKYFYSENVMRNSQLNYKPSRSVKHAKFISACVRALSHTMFLDWRTRFQHFDQISQNSADFKI